jgi:L-seryl-tRNA(Ser) seleniumtransferase
MVRALRVGKTTLAYMEAALKYYLDDDSLLENNTIFSTLRQKDEQILSKANRLQKILDDHGIRSTVIDNEGFCGGGALPDESIPSKAVRLELPFSTGRQRSAFAKKVFHRLLRSDPAVVSILRQGEILFDVMTLPEKDLEKVAGIIEKAFNKGK